MQDLTDFMREFLDYYFAQVHTDLPGVVVAYDHNKRRATVQPSLKRRAGNKEYINFPLLIDVPVLFPATKRYLIHIPLEENDEVAVFFSERALEEWKNIGQDDIEDPDPRRYSLSDAYCIPGLQAIEFIDVPEKGLVIKHKEKWDGDFISHILMDDEQIEVKYKEKAHILIEEDKILAETDEQKILMEHKYVYIISPNPIDFIGTGTRLGKVLQDYFDGIEKAFSQYIHIAPPKWFLKIVPPSPILQGMAQNGIKADVVKTTKKAKADLAKVLKG